MMMSKIVLVLIFTCVGAGSNIGWFDRSNRVEWKAVSTLYRDMNADMKAKGNAGHHIGKTESDQLMIHNIQGLLHAQQFTRSEAARHYNVSEALLSKVMETKPFNMEDKNGQNELLGIDSINEIDHFELKRQVKRKYVSHTLFFLIQD